MENRFNEGKIIIGKQEGNYTSHFESVKLIMHGFKGLVSQVLIAGKKVNTLDSQRVLVEWKEQGHLEDSIWLID
jgi:hypothetical protein